MFGGVRGVAWDPHTPGRTMIFDRAAARIFDLKSKQEVAQLVAARPEVSPSEAHLAAAAFDPHHSNSVVTMYQG